ncbi:hypothetical protein BESB_074490 [Besnoitia besnoiti]|uniref:Uncharacterized protein n=1 Tax=Besnoitia besnoiti TaxID=94643 RepID=A0A2A9MF88_BESBE|nr:uncharacterized protein BESB_074490 [Besnoitia besnoiti]PFH34297.1 hypothetical protein BESB_074490 [Besnoitia besnoiti]
MPASPFPCSSSLRLVRVSICLLGFVWLLLSFSSETRRRSGAEAGVVRDRLSSSSRLPLPSLFPARLSPLLLPRRHRYPGGSGRHAHLTNEWKALTSQNEWKALACYPAVAAEARADDHEDARACWGGEGGGACRQATPARVSALESFEFVAPSSPETLFHQVSGPASPYSRLAFVSLSAPFRSLSPFAPLPQRLLRAGVYGARCVSLSWLSFSPRGFSAPVSSPFFLVSLRLSDGLSLGSPALPSFPCGVVSVSSPEDSHLRAFAASGSAVGSLSASAAAAARVSGAFAGPVSHGYLGSRRGGASQLFARKPNPKAEKRARNFQRAFEEREKNAAREARRRLLRQREWYRQQEEDERRREAEARMQREKTAKSGAEAKEGEARGGGAATLSSSSSASSLSTGSRTLTELAQQAMSASGEGMRHRENWVIVGSTQRKARRRDRLPYSQRDFVKKVFTHLAEEELEKEVRKAERAWRGDMQLDELEEELGGPDALAPGGGTAGGFVR